MIVAIRPAARAGAAEMAGTEPFTENRLAALRAEGRPVFAYFTADWCLSCKVNEKTAIETDAVHDAFARNRVAVLVGDWTDGDPVLGRFIAQHDRAGVPLYLYYKPGAAGPRVLPQVLTQNMLMELASAR
jgi:thiol:disulfide interchange protein